jgi:hypothetical protein
VSGPSTKAKLLKKNVPLESELRDSLQRCQDKITPLEQENETHIKRMAAMQAAIDHLLARFGQS